MPRGIKKPTELEKFQTAVESVDLTKIENEEVKNQITNVRKVLRKVQLEEKIKKLQEQLEKL